MTQRHRFGWAAVRPRRPVAMRITSTMWILGLCVLCFVALSGKWQSYLKGCRFTSRSHHQLRSALLRNNLSIFFQPKCQSKLKKKKKENVEILQLVSQCISKVSVWKAVNNPSSVSNGRERRSSMFPAIVLPFCGWNTKRRNAEQSGIIENGTFIPPKKWGGGQWKAWKLFLDWKLCPS